VATLRTARSYVAIFWLIWLIIAALLSRGPMGSDRFAAAAGLGSVVLPVVCYLWCKADCAARTVRPPPGAIPLMAVLVPVGWAYYLFATRPPLKALGVVVGTVAATLTVLVIAQMIFGAGRHVAT
jgi:hypothetical protein